MDEEKQTECEFCLGDGGCDQVGIDAAVAVLEGEVGGLLPADATYSAREMRRVVRDILAAGQKDEVERYKAQAYQVLGTLLKGAGDTSVHFESDAGQRALDYFAYSLSPDDDFLPWPRQNEGLEKTP